MGKASAGQQTKYLAGPVQADGKMAVQVAHPGFVKLELSAAFGQADPGHRHPRVSSEASNAQLFAAASFSENPIRPASSGIPMSKTGTIRFIFAKTIAQQIRSPSRSPSAAHNPPPDRSADTGAAGFHTAPVFRTIHHSVNHFFFHYRC